ncbi:MAG: hypothetical protein KF692_10840 [Cryobacterium sp.]|nr:hypothetical protein [Micrococcales bacterium]MBX3079714.1 hypothetical protein [Cryobacterium sp.]
MSALPVEAPRRHPVQPAPRRHLDVVSTRVQKKARPKAVYALVTVAGLFAILIAQLLLSIMVSDGAYQISSLQQEQKELSRDQQSLTEQLQVLESPQHLAANAQALGMVTNSSTAYLRLSDGTVIGKPVAATASSGIRTGTDGGPLIPNQLLASVGLTPASSVHSATPTAGAPEANGSSTSVASSDAGIPSPITR